MALLDSSRSTLLIIDLQGKLVSLVHRPSLVMETAHRLLRLAELFRVPVVLTEQYPKGIGATEPGLRAAFDGVGAAPDRVTTRFSPRSPGDDLPSRFTGSAARPVSGAR